MLESISLDALDEVTGGTACGGCGCGCDPNAPNSATITRNKPLAAGKAFRRFAIPKMVPQAEPQAEG